MNLQNYLQHLLEQRQQDNLYRTRLTHENTHTPMLTIAGKTYLNFCSNDYLGLANHPRLVDSLQQNANKYGVGSGASHLVTGHSDIHHEAEQILAEFVGRERALLFSTGYMANLGIVSALLKRKDIIFSDKLNHASLIDAATLSPAQIQRYRHNELEHLQHLLAKSSAPHKLIMTDGVFSMDGDLASLPELVKLAKMHDAWIMVDDAHGLGVLGKNGRGTLEHYQLSQNDVPILMGTLGKALGVFGAFVAGSELLIDALIQFARTYIYTTALPPAIAGAVITSVDIVQKESWRREKLQESIHYFRHIAQQRDIPLMDSFTPIQPIMLGTADKAMQASQQLKEKGIIVTAIRPPTVPQNTARLRITLSASHEKSHIDKLLDSLANIW